MADLATGSGDEDLHFARIIARCDSSARIGCAILRVSALHDRCSGRPPMRTMGSAPVTITRAPMQACSTCRAIYRTDFERCPIDGGTLAPAISDPLVGTTIGEHYKIEALIGEGAMGRVYRAHHVRLVNKRYAVKVLIGDLAASLAMRIRFANEADNASRLEHPNIISVIDFGRSPEGLMFITMELAQGPSLGSIIHEGPMAPDRVIRLARQLCEALEHAHARGVVHRDLKPDNILVTLDDQIEIPRIADFGLAISVGETDARLTTSGIMCTPAYAAPEQLLGREVDHRADLYALGVTMYEMLTGGIRPFPGETPAVMSMKVLSDAPSVIAVAPNAPAALVGVIHRLLARDPEARPRSARQVIEMLDGACFAPTMALAAMPPARRSRWPLLAAAVAVALGVGGVSLRGAAAKLAPPDPDVRAHEIAVGSLRGATSIEQPPPPPPPLPAPLVIAPALPRVIPRTEPVDLGLVSAARTHVDLPARRPRPIVHVTPRVAEVAIAGSLTSAVVRRALDRIEPALRTCVAASGSHATATFAIDDARRASGVRTRGAASACLARALANVRTEVAPDTGDADVTLSFAY
jgi:serine/threonine-protein kinase